MVKLDYDTAARLIVPDFEAGKLFWRERTPDLFISTAGRTAEHACSLWNSVYAGKEAFTTLNGSGYLSGKFFYLTYKAHRVIWLLHTGEWPGADIDHINGDKTDNRLANLRCVSHAENQKNKRRARTNTSGITGVDWYAPTGKWRARITINGRRQSLGYFADISSAAASRRNAQIQYGFHENHGRA